MACKECGTPDVFDKLKEYVDYHDNGTIMVQASEAITDLNKRLKKLERKRK